MKLNIAFDLDGTLVDVFTMLTNYMEMVTGKRVEEPKDYGLMSDYGCSEEIVQQAINKMHLNWKSCQPLPHAKELWKDLWAATHDPITIVTARSTHYATETYALVNHIFGTHIPYRISFAKGNMGKSPYLYDFRYFVEDNGSTAWSLAKAGITVFLLKTSYNKDMWNIHSDIQPIDSLKDIVDLRRIFTGGV